jgi:P2-related tail formation protein
MRPRNVEPNKNNKGMERIMATGIADNDLAVALSDLIAERWGGFDLGPYMAYLIDYCSAGALPYLGEQFDVMGLHGWSVCDTELERRQLISRGIALHRYLGTVWAIKEGCRRVGLPASALQENTAGWGTFQIVVDADSSKKVTDAGMGALRAFIEFYKNERSHLTGLGFREGMSDDFICREELYMSIVYNDLVSYNDLNYSDDYDC